jgi:signal transduction histidine kinase/FixJ family two-component response regulator
MLNKIVDFFRKSLTRRLYFSGALFLLPLLFVGTILINQLNQRIRFDKTELEGAQIAVVALEFKHKFSNELINIANNKKNLRSYSPQIEQLKAIELEKGTNPRIKASINAVLLLAKKVEAENYQDTQSIENALLISNSLVDLISSEYKLLLDPIADTYSLMDFSLSHSGAIIDNLQLLRLDGSNLKTAHSLDYQLGAISSNAKIYIASGYFVLKNLEKSSDLEIFAEQLSTFNRLMDTVINDRDFEIALPKLINQHYLVNNNAVILLSKKIQKRLDENRLRRFFIIIASALLYMGGFLLVFLNVRRGVVMPIKRLTQSMSDVSSGDYEGTLRDLNRIDEVGEMSRALAILRENSVAKGIAESATKAKAEFLAIMSHEIRTPMNGVLGMAQALKNTKLNQNQNDMVNVIVESGGALVTLLNDILDMSKLEAGKLDIENIAMAPCAIIKGSIALFEKRLSENIQIKHDINSDVLGWYMGDPNRLRQILNNLISNAIKFTQKGEVTISLEKVNKETLRFIVKDTGIGIPKEKLDLLFKKFSQVDTSHSRIYGGSGLGLSISEGLVRMMGGKIWVESEIGVGSSFIFEIPALEVSSSIEKIECDKCENCENSECINYNMAKEPIESVGVIVDIGDETESANIENGNEETQILVAEDNETNRIVLKTLLAQIGLSPDFVENGQDAFEAWVGKHYDIVLMDMQMPVLNGLEAICAIRDFETRFRRPHTPIVALSANAFEDQIKEQLAAGADAHCPKPIVLSQLLSAMSNAINNNFEDKFLQKNQQKSQKSHNV